MKIILTFVAISISLISWGRDRARFENKVDSITSLQQQNHYYLDTLWVIDSSQNYVYRNYPNVNCRLDRIYKVISRNDNVLISSYFHPDDYPLVYQDNWIDTISYFDGLNVFKHTKNIWNSSINNWQVYEYEEFEPSGLLKETYKIDYSNVSQHYNPSHRYFYDNSNGRIDVETGSVYVSGNNTWKSDYKQLNYYDGFGNDTLIVKKDWINNGWQNDNKESNSYLQGLRVSSIIMNFDPTNNTWSNFWKFNHSYNEDALVDTSWHWIWHTDNNYWVEQSITYFSYDSMKRYKQVIQTRYNNTTQQLENDVNILFDYSNNNYVETWQFWKLPEGYWINEKRYTNSFLADDKYDTIQQESWSQNQEKWYVKYRTVNEYDHRENLIAQNKYYVYYITYELYLQDSTRYFWSAFGASSVDVPLQKSIFAYPNPASTHINFKFNQLPQNNSTLYIYNLAGQKVDEITLSKEGSTWDCIGVKSGIYIYSVIFDGDKVTGKVVVR
jgi:type IX secretion system substrate protein